MNIMIGGEATIHFIHNFILSYFVKNLSTNLSFIFYPQNFYREFAVELCKREVSIFARIKKLNPFALCIFSRVGNFVRWQKMQRANSLFRAKILTSLCILSFY